MFMMLLSTLFVITAPVIFDYSTLVQFFGKIFLAKFWQAYAYAYGYGKIFWQAYAYAIKLFFYNTALVTIIDYEGLPSLHILFHTEW